MDTTLFKVYWNLLESAGVKQSLVESTDSGRLWWTPFRLDILNWTNSVQNLSLAKSTGVQWSQADSAGICGAV